MDDGNEMILSLSLVPIVKYRLRERGWWDGYDLLQRAQRNQSPTIPTLFPA